MTRARGIRWAVAIAVVVACGLVVSCSHSNVRRVSGQEFQRLACVGHDDAAKHAVHWRHRDEGVSGGDWHYSSFEKDSTAVVWTPLSELPPPNWRGI